MEANRQIAIAESSRALDFFRVHPAKLIVMTTPIRDTGIGAEIAVVRDVLDAIQRADISAAMALVAHACN